MGGHRLGWSVSTVVGVDVGDALPSSTEVRRMLVRRTVSTNSNKYCAALRSCVAGASRKVDTAQVCLLACMLGTVVLVWLGWCWVSQIEGRLACRCSQEGGACEGLSLFLSLEVELYGASRSTRQSEIE